MDRPVSTPIMPVGFGFWNHGRWTVVLSISNKLTINPCSTWIWPPFVAQPFTAFYIMHTLTRPCTVVGTYSTPDFLLSYLYMGTPYFCGKFNLVFIRWMIFATTLFAHSSVEPTNTKLLSWHSISPILNPESLSGTSSPLINVPQGTEWSILVTLLITMASPCVIRKCGMEVWKCQLSDQGILLIVIIYPFRFRCKIQQCNIIIITVDEQAEKYRYMLFSRCPSYAALFAIPATSFLSLYDAQLMSL